MKSITFKSHWFWILIIILSTLFAVYIGLRLLGQTIFVPKGFLEARTRGADIANSIVALSTDSVNNLKTIQLQNDLKNYEDGLNSVIKEIARNEDARKDAISLSSQLETMAGSIADIRPKTASDMALRAIIIESQIAQRLINYNGYIAELLSDFQSRFAKGSKVNEQAVKDLISKMDGEISSINDLNEQYRGLMSQFDELTSVKH